MKRKIYHLATSLLLLSLLFLGACSEEEETLSKAVLASTSSLDFSAEEAAEKIITVYADADWVSEVPDWITVTPSAGSGTMEVTIAVADNVRDEAIDNPRKASIVFKGATLASRAEVLVTQQGDKYRDCRHYALEELPALADETVVSVQEAIVKAVTTEGFIVSDAENRTNIYIEGNATVRVGDRVSIKGTKFTDATALPYIECDQTDVTPGTTPPTYPEATDITAQADSYNATSREYIKVNGVLNGTNVTIEGATTSVSLVSVPESLGLAAFNGHRVTVSGYYAGKAAPSSS